MPIHQFLAMTAAEMRNLSTFPEKTAWMACHFSPYGQGLSNLPVSLPPDSLLLLDDSIPPHGHDPEWIVEQLEDCIHRLGCQGVLLDFQKPDNPETAKLASVLAASLPCPVAVSWQYAQDVDCPVFLPPVPPSVALEAYFAPWKGRDIWLELALDGEVITLTELGAEVTPLPHPEPNPQGFAEDNLHCHYQIQLEDAAARFTLWRTKEDLDALIAGAEALGVSCCVGLYQELHSFT